MQQYRTLIICITSIVALIIIVNRFDSWQENQSVHNSQGKVSDPRVSAENLSLEHKFAIVNAGHNIAVNDPSVSKSKELLYRASLDYGETELAIADMSVAASKHIKKDGINVSALDVLEAGALSYTAQPNPDYAETVSMYVVLRSGGQSHTEAILGLKGMFKLLAGK